jgi:RNA polymerase sigma-70 factor (ECF subfamily)
VEVLQTLDKTGITDTASVMMSYRAIAVNICRGLVKDSDTAEDVVQVVLASVIRKLSMDEITFNSREHLRNYFFKSVRNRAMDVLKDRDRWLSDSDSVLSNLEGNGEDPLQALLSVEEDEKHIRRLDEITNGLKSLKKHEQEIILYRFMRGMKYREISEETGVPITTLKSREDSALRKLRKILVKSGLASYT